MAGPPPPPTDHTWHHSYDGLGRLIISCSDWNGTSCDGDTFTYNSYDGAGNLTRFDKWNATTQSVEIVRYVYNGANQIKCVDADNSQACDGTEFLYVYDAYGNLTNDGASTYVYDAENRLISVTTIAPPPATTTSITTYAYNGDGDRIKQEVDADTNATTFERTRYVIDMATPLTMVLSETTVTVDKTTQAESNGSTIHYWQG